MTTTFSRMFQRRGTAAQWAANSTIIPAAGEICHETDTARLKVGDGVTQYGALQYIGHDQGVTFANSAEVLSGLASDLSVAPDTLSANYPRRAVGAVDSVINNNWSFNNAATFNGITRVIPAPRSGVTGVNDATNRAYIDSLFAGQVSIGPGDVNKAPILNSDGQLDISYISSSALPRAIGLFSPVTGVPTLQNVVGGGISPPANNGDYFISSDSGFYNFDTGTPGAGTTVTQGAQIIFFESTTSWNVVNPPGTSFDPGAVRKSPTNNSESLILPVTDAVSNLTLQNRVGQTVRPFRVLDQGAVLIAGINSVGVLEGIGVNVERVSSTSDSGADYPQGFSNSYVTTVSGWPIDGALLTYKQNNTSVYQSLMDADQFYTRQFTGTWSAWVQYAKLNSPAFTGVPTVPTAATAANNDQAANTAHVKNVLADSPALGGNPTAPTATQGDADTSVANTRFATELVNPYVEVVGLAVPVTTSSIWVPVKFNTKVSDLNSAFVLATGVFTVPTNGAGIYHCSLQTILVNNDASSRVYVIGADINGTGLPVRQMDRKLIVSGGTETLHGSVQINLSAGDTIALGIQNPAATSYTYGFATTTNVLNWLTIQRVGAPLLIA